MNQDQWLMTIENGLSAHFNQENAPSRPGVMWAVHIKQANSDTVYTTMVKALYADDLLPKYQKDRQYQAQIAMQYLNDKIRSGWHPKNEIEHTIYISNPIQPGFSQNKDKKWWKFW